MQRKLPANCATWKKESHADLHFLSMAAVGAGYAGRPYTLYEENDIFQRIAMRLVCHWSIITKKRTTPIRKINNIIECNISCHLLCCSMLQICFVLHSINSGNYHYANIFIASLFPASFHLLFLLLLCTFVAADTAAVCCIFKYKSIPALS